MYFEVLRKKRSKNKAGVQNVNFIPNCICLTLEMKKVSSAPIAVYEGCACFLSLPTLALKRIVNYLRQSMH